MAEKIFEATSFLPTLVLPDGKTLVLGMIDGADRRQPITLPSPVAPHLIADLQRANGEARDRFVGTPQRKGAAMRLTVQQPQTLNILRDAVTGQLLMVFDRGLPGELAFAVPAKFEEELVSGFLRSRRRGGPPTRQ